MPPLLRSGECKKLQQLNIELAFYKQAADELGAKTTVRGCRRTLGVVKCVAGRSYGYGGGLGTKGNSGIWNLIKFVNNGGFAEGA